MAKDRWPIQLANIIRAARDFELSMAKLQEAMAPSPRALQILQAMAERLDRDTAPGGAEGQAQATPGLAHHAVHGCSVVPIWRETPLTEGDPNPVVPQSLRTVLNENDSQVQGDAP